MAEKLVERMAKIIKETTQEATGFWMLPSSANTVAQAAITAILPNRDEAITLLGLVYAQQCGGSMTVDVKAMEVAYDALIKHIRG